MTMHRTWVELNERALQDNIRQLQALLAPGARFCAVVKANAYGHGLREVATIAARTNVTAFAVDNIDDAMELRALLPGALIITLGYLLLDRAAEAIDAGIDLTIYDREHLVKLEEVAASKAKTARVHLKLETGTARQGIFPDDLADFLDVLRRCPHLELTGVSTHFANAEEAEDPSFASYQYQQFSVCVEKIRDAGFSPEHIHCACSAAIILYPQTHGTLVRAGVSLYGLWSSEETQRVARRHLIKLDLTPVLSWKTRVAQIKSFPAGTTIGYDRTETLRRNSRVAVLPVGYWDGYDRGLSNTAEVIIGGTRCRVLGRVCMNMMMVDVSAVANVELEQEVLLLGRSGRHEISAELLATTAQTINYEFVTRINAAIPRVIV